MNKAKGKGLVAELRPVVEMLQQCGFRLADSTKRDFLSAAGEG